jgi:hypothetical protein
MGSDQAIYFIINEKGPIYTCFLPLNPHFGEQNHHFKQFTSTLLN